MDSTFSLIEYVNHFGFDNSISHIYDTNKINRDPGKNLFFFENSNKVLLDFIPQDISDDLLQLYQFITGSYYKIERGTLVYMVFHPVFTISKISL